MAISLKKGQGVSLKKSENDLSMVTIGLGWDILEEKSGFLGGLFAKKPAEYDLDVVAFLCGADGKVHDLGKIENDRPSLVNGDVVFFNSMRHHSGQIWLTGDNRTGAGEGDDEQIIVSVWRKTRKHMLYQYVTIRDDEGRLQCQSNMLLE